MKDVGRMEMPTPVFCHGRMAARVFCHGRMEMPTRVFCYVQTDGGVFADLSSLPSHPGMIGDDNASLHFRGGEEDEEVHRDQSRSGWRV